MEITSDAITHNRSCGARSCPTPSLEAGNGFGLSQWWRSWELTVCNLLREHTVVGGSVFQVGRRQGPWPILKKSHISHQALAMLAKAAALACWFEVQGALLQKRFSNPSETFTVPEFHYENGDFVPPRSWLCFSSELSGLGSSWMPLRSAVEMSAMSERLLYNCTAIL